MNIPDSKLSDIEASVSFLFIVSGNQEFGKGLVGQCWLQVRQTVWPQLEQQGAGAAGGRRDLFLSSHGLCMGQPGLPHNMVASA